MGSKMKPHNNSNSCWCMWECTGVWVLCKYTVSHTFVFELWGGNLQCLLNILTFRLQSLMGFMLLGNLYLENSIFHPLNRYSFGLENKIKNRSEYKSATKKGKGKLVSTLVVSNRKYQYCNLQVKSLYRL